MKPSPLMLERYKQAAQLLRQAEADGLQQCRFMMAVTIDGDPCNPKSEAACQWCALGVLMKLDSAYLVYGQGDLLSFANDIERLTFGQIADRLESIT